MRFTNTLTGEKEELVIPSGRPLHLFVCGPTVYDEIHIGNARTYAVFDTLAKYLRSKKIKIFYLENITDIDDRIIAKGIETGTSAQKIAHTYTAAFEKMTKALRIDSVNKYAPATRFIAEIIRQIQTLIKNGNAYEIKGDGWYFNLSTFPEYGKLAKRTVEQAEDGTSRIDENPGKRNRGDFCLWKFSRANEPVWKAPFGAGRPGWHIEDTAISEHFFGSQYDIHGGGRDLIFPHHEAEIAQQESASGKKPFVKIWIHAGLVTVLGRKMSKSLGNFITVRDFLKTKNANVFRLLVARNHYRSAMNFGDEAVRETETILSAFKETFAKLTLAGKKKVSEANLNLASFEKEFSDAMDDDLNTPEAIAVLFKMLSALNINMWKITKSEAKRAKTWISEKLKLLGIIVEVEKIPLKVKGLATLRERARRHQQFIKSDALRKRIEGLGYSLDDTPGGPLILKKSK